MHFHRTPSLHHFSLFKNVFARYSSVLKTSQKGSIYSFLPLFLDPLVFIFCHAKYFILKSPNCALPPWSILATTRTKDLLQSAGLACLVTLVPSLVAGLFIWVALITHEVANGLWIPTGNFMLQKTCIDHRLVKLVASALQFHTFHIVFAF